MSSWEGLSRCHLVGSCVLPGEDSHRPTCKTTFARLTQSQAISQSFRVFISFRSMRDTTFFHFLKLFLIQNYRFLYHGDQKISWWTLQVAGGQLRNPPVKFRHERWLHLAIDQHPACPNRGRLELWPRKWFLLFWDKSVTLSMLIDLLTSTCTAWDSEIESLTSLIKLHQNERRSAPCGQIGAATQPPELATSPTLKKFWVARAFEVRWACTCCHDRTGFNGCLLPLSILISVFSLFHWELCTTLNAHSTLAYSQHQHQATSWWHDGALVRCCMSHAQQ